ncbi:hypothetical protein NUW54_g10950 [Trametes sanguinea]|uniref:Uncharacterized protein n=1 Tax=Trametes sanguinea TaxID=158606 RepID=A0ACC1NPI9_9APHY|nr:hypothetical protein NUW54_g10950 [Trametes sanguinea]
MVCKKCENKTSKLAAPDPFKSTSQAIKEGSRKVGENKLLGRPGSSKNRFQPYQGKCKDCKSTVTQNKAKYCHGCAYKRGHGPEVSRSLAPKTLVRSRTHHLLEPFAKGGDYQAVRHYEWDRCIENPVSITFRTGYRPNPSSVPSVADELTLRADDQDLDPGDIDVQQPAILPSEAGVSLMSTARDEARMDMFEQLRDQTFEVIDVSKDVDYPPAVSHDALHVDVLRDLSLSTRYTLSPQSQSSSCPSSPYSLLSTPYSSVCSPRPYDVHDHHALCTSDFRPIRQLGKGGHGTVYLVEDIVSDRHLAMKVIEKNGLRLREYPVVFEEQASSRPRTRMSSA